MNQTKLLVLLIVSVLLVNYVNYMQIDKAKMLKRVETIDKRIQNERFIARMYRENPEGLMQNDDNISRYFYAEQTDPSLAMAAAGQRLKELVKRHDLQLDKLTWGEPYRIADAWYTVLPFSLRFSGYPADFVRFYDDLLTTGELLHVTTFSAKRDNKRKIVDFELGVAAYKARKASDD